jgi:hypothetical protein
MGTSTLVVSEVAYATLDEWNRDGPACLRRLNDPEFFRTWSAVRICLFLTPPDRRHEIKPLYDAVADEYRRRMTGGLAAC